MKKKYIIPQTELTKMSCETLMAQSLGKYSTGADSDVVLVKGNDASPRSDYNVWNDDWSK